MAEDTPKESSVAPEDGSSSGGTNNGNEAGTGTVRWRKFLGMKKSDADRWEERESNREAWTMGILNDKQTDEVPGKSRVDIFHANSLIIINHI